MPKPSQISSFRQSIVYKLIKNALFFLIVFFALQAWQQRNMAVGDAPPFQAELLDGETITLQSYQGKPLLLHFWSSTCHICRLEEGSISDLNQDKDTQILTIAFYSGDSNAVHTYLKKQNLIDWPVTLDPDGELGQKFGVFATPSTFYIGPDGKIKYRTIGFTSKWGMKVRLWLAGL